MRRFIAPDSFGTALRDRAPRIVIDNFAAAADRSNPAVRLATSTEPLRIALRMRAIGRRF